MAQLRVSPLNINTKTWGSVQDILKIVHVCTSVRLDFLKSPSIGYKQKLAHVPEKSPLEGPREGQASMNRTKTHYIIHQTYFLKLKDRKNVSWLRAKGLKSSDIGSLMSTF